MDTSKFDIADYLDSNEMIIRISYYVFEKGDNADVFTAIGIL